MCAKSFGKMVLSAVVFVFVSAVCVHADKMQLQEKLSKGIKIQLTDVTIAEALQTIGQKAGLKIVLSDEAAWKLPQGEATRLSVTLDGPLAESLTEMLNAFFMRYAVGDEVVMIYPRPELEHILGRPTPKQLELLKAIYTNALRERIFGNLGQTINELLGQAVVLSPIVYYKELDNRLDMLMVGPQPAPEGVGGASFGRSGLVTSITLAQLLGQLGRAWYIAGQGLPNQVPEIRLVDEREFRQAKLDQVVDVSFKEEKAELIVQRLANWIGMELYITKQDPAWLQEKISVDMQNIKLRQTLVNILTMVDGRIDILLDRNQIFTTGPVHPGKPAPVEPAKGKGDDYVGKISIPMEGGKYFVEFMLRESDLTEQLKKLRQDKMKEILGESPKPAEKPKQ